MSVFLIAVVIVNILISYKGFNDYNFFRKYEFHIRSIKSGEQIRMFSSGFLHADLVHLLFNMITLWFFAPIVIDFLGNFFFVLLYVGSLLFGNLLTMHFHKDTPDYRAVGASGAVTGILYSAILLQPDMTLGLYFIIPIPAYLFGILYLFYSIYGMKSNNDNIGHTAHFGGAVGGFVLTIAKDFSVVIDHYFMVILLLIPIIVLYILAQKGKI